MSLPHFQPRALVVGALALGLSLGLAEQATAGDLPLQTLRAPFTCETEWAGSTRAGHGLNNWNLDINRTSRTFSEPQHDLGQPLLAQADGTIVWIGYHVSAGTYVEIDYGDLTVRYIHLVAGSVPGLLNGSELVEGQLFGLLGDSGNATHAHLHLEYFDSRDYDDARAYLLPASNQVQIAMDGEPIDPGEAFVSTNCGDGPPPTSSTSTTTTTTTTTTSGPPHPFTDVDPTSFAYEDIGLLFDLAITTGTTSDTYSPGDDVTREQMAAFLGRTWRLLAPTDLSQTGDQSGEPAVPEIDNPFDDVDPDSFAYDDIALIHRLGITTGTGPTSYSPGDDVTREQMAAFLGRMWLLLDPVEVTPQSVDLPDPLTPYPFQDVDPDSFAHSSIALIHDLGITTGTSADTYSPADDITREQMAAFLARLYRLNAETTQAL